MANNETIDDIVAEKRALADRLEHEMAVAKECKELIAHRTAQAIIDSTRREADRLEAALKRERGDCAKLREAIAKVVEIAEREWDAFRETPAMWEIHEICKAALAEPPRNCDRPECATTKAAQDVWRREDGGKTAYYEWLLATAKEGGKNGNE